VSVGNRRLRKESSSAQFSLLEDGEPAAFHRRATPHLHSWQHSSAGRSWMSLVQL